MDDAESYQSMHRQYPIFCTDGACSYATRFCCHPEHLTEGFTSLAGKITHSFASSGSFHQKLNISKMHDSALHSKFLRENHRFTHIHLVQEIMSYGPTYYLQKFSNNVSMTENLHILASSGLIHQHQIMIMAMGWIQIYMQKSTYQGQGRRRDVEAHGIVGPRSNTCTSNQSSSHHKEQEASHIWPSGVPCSHKCTRTHSFRVCNIGVDRTSILHSHMLHVHRTTRIIRKLSPNIDESVATKCLAQLL